MRYFIQTKYDIVKMKNIAKLQQVPLRPNQTYSKTKVHIDCFGLKKSQKIIKNVYLML